MKLKNWLYGVMALSMLASCSDKDFAPTAGADDGSSANATAGSGYLAVEIKLPQVASTRADGDSPTDGIDGKNDYYEDGESWEYNVDNALIILFTGKEKEVTLSDGKKILVPNKNEEITYLRAQELTKPFFWSAEANDNITTSYLAAIQVQNKNFSDHLWAIIMLNRDNSKFVYDGDEDIVTINGTKIKTYADLLAATSTSDSDDDFIIPSTSSAGEKRIFMTNAPLANIRGGIYGTDAALANPGIQTIADLGTTNQLYDSMEEAKSNPAACIFVERAMAKVTYGGMNSGAIQFQFQQRVPQIDSDGNPVKDSDGNIVYEDKDILGEDINIKDVLDISSNVFYCLTNKNKESYVVRNVDFTGENGVNHFSWALTSGKGDKYRMIGSVGMPALKTPFHQEYKDLYRTYWCNDPNYDSEMADEDKIEYTETSFVNTSTALYAKENTFTVKNQSYGNTTLAVFKVDFNISKKNTEGTIGQSNGSLYIRDDNKEKVYLTPEEAMAPAFLRVYNNDAIKAALKSLAKKDVTGSYNVADYVKVKWTVDNKKKVTWNNVVIEVPANDPFFPTSITEGDKNIPIDQAFHNLVGTYSATSSITTLYDLLTDINNWFDVTEYTGGISYYIVPIQHFGDHSCPWNGKGTDTKDTYNNGDDFNDADMEHANKYLGRYGMVRNNWYELNISEIKALGSAVPPTIDDDLSDDFKEDKKYFAVEIHTLSWAKRTQNVKF